MNTPTSLVNFNFPKMNNLIFSTRNIDDFINDVANEVAKKIELWAVNLPQPTEQPDQLLTIQQAAEFLNLTVPTLYGYVHANKIPVSKPGKRLYFSKHELLEWAKAGRKKTLKDIEAEADQYLTKPDKKGREANND